MLTKEENELLTQTGPGTPCGELMRRYWQPAALSEELPPGSAPLPVQLLGEDLVLFRDPSTGSGQAPSTGSGQAGRPGLLGIHCSHRGADLSYGRIEDGGLRCIYHGWLYDIHGRCLDQPGEPSNSWTHSAARSRSHSAGPSWDAAQGWVAKELEGQTRLLGTPFRERIRHTAYPCEERGGVIFAYLGPGEPPLLPNYAYFTVPDEQRYATKIYSECNYLQGNEGNIDLLHTSFLHYIRRDLQRLQPDERRAVMERYEAPESLSGRGPSPGLETCEAQPIPYGLRICKIRKAGEDTYVRFATFLLPNLTVIPGGGINWHVPIDDMHHWKYILHFSRDHALPRRGDWDELAPAPHYRPVPNKANRYLQDRASMGITSYCGIPQKYFAAQDLCATEGAGPIQDRTQEHLAPTDAPIAAARNILRKAIKDVQEGSDPPHVVRDPDLNDFPEVVGTYGLVPRRMTWKEYAAELVAAGKGWQTLAAG